MAQFAAVPATPMTDAWRSWIAENLMLDCDPASLIQALMAHGIARSTAQAEIAAAVRSPYLAGANRLRNRLAKRDWALDIYRQLNRLRPGGIARRHRLGSDEFLREYYSTNQPVIITGMMEQWPAIKKWNPDYLRAEFGACEVEVQFGRNADPDYEMNSLAHKRLMPFGAYVDLVTASGHTNDFYMTANNDAKNRASLRGLWEDIDNLPAYLQASTECGFFWFGPAGTVTPFHHDLTNNLMAQVLGRKRVRLIAACELARLPNPRHCFTPVDGRSIDLARFPQMAEVPVQECILAPGEILFLPVGCWHFVESLEIAATMAFTNFRWPNDFYSNYPSERDF